MRNFNRWRVPIILILAGICCMFLGKFLNRIELSSDTTVADKENYTVASSTFYDGATAATVTDWRAITEYHQNRLTAFLQNVKDVGTVSVLVYCDQSSILELVKNSDVESQIVTEKDQNGGQRETESTKENDDYLLIQDSNGNQRVVAVSESIPAIESICVVCSGGDKMAVRERVTVALSALYDLPASRISVIPGK